MRLRRLFTVGGWLLLLILTQVVLGWEVGLGTKSDGRWGWGQSRSDGSTWISLGGEENGKRWVTHFFYKGHEVKGVFISFLKVGSSNNSLFICWWGWYRKGKKVVHTRESGARVGGSSVEQALHWKNQKICRGAAWLEGCVVEKLRSLHFYHFCLGYCCYVKGFFVIQILWTIIKYPFLHLLPASSYIVESFDYFVFSQ